MAVPPALAIPGAAVGPVAPIFRFVGGPAPNAVWVPACGAQPLVEVAADEPFAALASCIDWTPYPPPPSAPTHLRCLMAWPEFLFTACSFSDENDYLDSAPLARCLRPAELGEIWAALVESNLVPLDKPIMDFNTLLKLCMTAAASLPRDEARIRITLARTCPVEPAPVNGALSARWPMLVLSRAINRAHGSPFVSLFTEAWLMWRCRNRCTNAVRLVATNPVNALFEDVRVRAVALYPLMAPHLSLVGANVNLIAATVGAELSKLVLPVEMLRYPELDYQELMDATMIAMYLFGTDAERETAFCERLPTILVHFPEVKFVLQAQSHSVLSSASLGGFLKQLTALHIGSQLVGQHVDPWSVNTLQSLEALCRGPNDEMRASSDPPHDVAMKLLFHSEHLRRIKDARKAEMKSQDGASVSRVGGVQSTEFRIASPYLIALCSMVSPDVNAIFQHAFQCRSKLIVMYLMELTSSVSGFPLFTSLSPFRGEFGLYLGWCLSVDASGEVPTRGRDKSVGALHVTALKKGRWTEELDLFNLCRMWEMHLANKPFSPIGPDGLYLDSAWLKTMKKYGLRLFSGINRAGGSEEDEGSFLWAVKTGMDLLDARETNQLAPADTDDLVQWWFHAALGEAGKLFQGEVKGDTDFSKLMSSVFLRRTPGGCIEQLESKQKNRTKWSSMVDDMPFTVGLVMNQSTNVSSPTSSAVSLAVSSVSQLKTSTLSVPKAGQSRASGGNSTCSAAQCIS